MSYENWLNFVFIFLIFVLTKQLESSTILASLEPDVKPVLGSDKGPFHRVVGLPVVFGLPGDFLLGEGRNHFHLKTGLYKKNRIH